MKTSSALVLLSVLSSNVYAVKLSDYSPYKFEALFTNPVCDTYKYSSPVQSNAGANLVSKPDDVYCKQTDENRSVSRSNSPQYRLKEWVSRADTKEIYMAYLSFSSPKMTQALCDAAKAGVKFTIVLDHGEDAEIPVLSPSAEKIKNECAKYSGQVNLTYRGSTGGLGFAHNKIMIINPRSTSETKIVFSSGNMSSGTSTNHENWNFVTTSPESYFAQAHKCAVEAMVGSGDTKANFTKHLNTCRNAIVAEPEKDIQVFFAPVDGALALKTFDSAGKRSKLVEGMSHRLSGQVAKSLQSFLKKGVPVRFILDDDIYWSKSTGVDTGRNTVVEAINIYRDLINKGMQTKFLETNHQIFQLQHNKLMVFHFNHGGAVFNGAGNFTSSAFTRNFENFYYITIPEVVEAYKEQYRKYYDKMATAEKDMPIENILP